MQRADHIGCSVAHDTAGETSSYWHSKYSAQLNSSLMSMQNCIRMRELVDGSVATYVSDANQENAGRFTSFPIIFTIIPGLLVFLALFFLFYYSRSQCYLRILERTRRIIINCGFGVAVRCIRPHWDARASALIRERARKIVKEWNVYARKLFGVIYVFRRSHKLQIIRKSVSQFASEIYIPPCHTYTLAHTVMIAPSMFNAHVWWAQAVCFPCDK